MKRDPRLIKIVEECYGDTRLFGTRFMPHRYFRGFSEIHTDYFGKLDNEKIPKLVIAAPRGIGKTSNAIAYATKNVVYRMRKFVEVVSATKDIAIQNVVAIGRELTENPLIHKVFGPQKGRRWSESKGLLTTNSDEFGNSVTIIARGAGQQVRGLLQELGARPDLIIIDDLQESEPFRIGDASEYVRKIDEWFFTDLLNSQAIGPTTRIVEVGTIMGEDCHMARMLEDPDWAKVEIELCDDNYKSKYPEYMTTKQVKALAASYKRRGMLDLFYREFRNLPIAKEGALFQQKYFKYWQVGEDLVNDVTVEKMVIVDPAKTIKTESDFTSVNGVGFQSWKNRIVQLDCESDKLKPDGIYEAAWTMAKRLKTFTIAVEVTGIEDFIVYPFNQYLRRHGFPDIIPLKASKNAKKIDRIKQLAPLYRMGVIEHHPNDEINGPLEGQLLAMPRPRKWDVADGWAYLIKLFALGERYFDMAESESIQDLDREIQALDDAEKMIEESFGNAPQFDGWRIA